MIGIDVIYHEESADNGTIGDDGDNWYGDDDIGLGEVGVRTGVTE